MNNLRKYTDRFFDALEVFEDVSRGHNYKAFLRQAVIEFLDNETKETAFAVYDSFFDSYRITLNGEGNPFIDLMDVLHDYEEKAGTLIDRQRDHLIHAVNVFIIGLSIYAQNANFRDIFDAANMDKTEYPFSYDTKHEEFFYRWGLASLFNDIGYPVEIIDKQIKKFMTFATEVDAKDGVKPHLEFDNFEEFNSIAEIIPKHEFIKSYYEKYDSCVYVDLLNPIDLLAQKLNISLNVDLVAVKASLDGFVDLMADRGFIDHGFFSAIIVLKWYGFLIQRCRYKPEYFFFPVLDSASAILLHNYYRNMMMKPPFNKGHFSPHEHPIAWLLILCDELQDWNREAYGIEDKKRVQAGEALLLITDSRLDVTYIAKSGIPVEKYSTEKENFLCNYLDLAAVFDGGFSIGCEEIDSLAALPIELRQDTQIVPRPLIDNLEKLAIATHELYNQKQLESHPDKPVSFPDFSDLPDSMKYSNLRQARSIYKKLEMMGWEMRRQGGEGEVITEIPADIVETLAQVEHEQWIQERESSGWVVGDIKNVSGKVSPYLVPYGQLPEEIKDLDRDTIRNIPDLLAMIGMSIYKR